MVCIEEVGHRATIATSAKLSRNYQAKWAVIEAFQLNRGLRGDSFKRQSANITNALNFKRTYPSSLLAPFFKTLRDLAGSVPGMYLYHSGKRGGLERGQLLYQFSIFFH